MNTTQSKSWNHRSLAQFGQYMGEGYDPGMGSNAPAREVWTSQDHLRVANLLGRGYNPGL